MKERKYGKKNKLSTNILNYNIYLGGVMKVGKSSTIKEVCEKIVGDEGYIMYSVGSEQGVDAIEGAVFEHIPDWDTMIEINDYITENKEEEFKELKVIVFDTLDQIIDIATRYVVDKWNRRNPDKRADSINGVAGGYGRGEKLVMSLIDDEVTKLRNVGIKIIWIGHVKNKEITDVISGSTYTILTSDQQSNYFNHFKKQMDIVALMYSDMEMVKEQVKDKFTGKNKMVGKLVGETRRIRFRDSAYATDTGSRFKHIVEEIEATPEAFIKAIQDAIKAEIEEKGGNLEERIKEDDKKEKDEERVAIENSKKIKEEHKLKEIQAKITQYISENKTDIDKIKGLLAKAKELGVTNPTEITNLKDAMEIAKLIKE